MKVIGYKMKAPDKKLISILRKYVGEFVTESKKIREADISDGTKVPHGSSKHISDLKSRIASLTIWRDGAARGSDKRANYARVINDLKSQLASAVRAKAKKTLKTEATVSNVSDVSKYTCDSCGELIPATDVARFWDESNSSEWPPSICDDCAEHEIEPEHKRETSFSRETRDLDAIDKEEFATSDDYMMTGIHDVDEDFKDWLEFRKEQRKEPKLLSKYACENCGELISQSEVNRFYEEGNSTEYPPGWCEECVEDEVKP